MNAPHLSCLTANERAAVDQYISRLCERFPDRILSVTLFGSKARGDADAESDIDLLVLVDTEGRRFRSELLQIASDVSLEHNVVLSVRVFSQARWLETERLRPPLYRAIAAEGVLVGPERAPS